MIIFMHVEKAFERVRKMTVSANMNGKNVGQANGGIRQHMERDDEKSGVTASLYSDSKIDPSLSKYNVALKKFKGNPIKEIRDDFEEINEIRRGHGLRKAQKNKGIFMTSTLQLSDNSLELLGWIHDPVYLQALEEGWNKDKIKSEKITKWLTVDKQDKQAVENVKLVYEDMLGSIEKQPDRYGVVKGAFLHFDESSPHVDVLQNCLDTNDFEFEQSGALYYTHGTKGLTKKGVRLSEAQDHLMDYTKFSPETIEKFDLKRGERGADKKDLVKDLRTSEAVFEVKEKRLDAERAEFQDDKRVFENDKLNFSDKTERFEREKEEFDTEKEEYERKTKEELKQELESVVRADLVTTLKDDPELLSKAKREKIDEINRSIAQQKEAVKTARADGFNKGVNAGLKAVGKYLNDKMSGSNYVREKILKDFEDGKYKPMVNGWDKAADIAKREKNGQSVLVSEIINVQLEDDGLEM